MADADIQEFRRQIDTLAPQLRGEHAEDLRTLRACGRTLVDLAAKYCRNERAETLELVDNTQTLIEFAIVSRGLDAACTEIAPPE